MKMLTSFAKNGDSSIFNNTMNFTSLSTPETLQLMLLKPLLKIHCNLKQTSCSWKTSLILFLEDQKNLKILTLLKNLPSYKPIKTLLLYFLKLKMMIDTELKHFFNTFSPKMKNTINFLKYSTHLCQISTLINSCLYLMNLPKKKKNNSTTLLMNVSRGLQSQKSKLCNNISKKNKTFKKHQKN